MSTDSDQLRSSPTAPGEGAPVAARRLRRVEEDRIVGGVAGGLGSYFSLDPVLFRVLFATTTIVGGLGVVVYLVLWAAMPGTDATDSVVDRLLGALGEHRFASGAIVFLGLVAWVSVVQRRPWGVWPVVVTVALVAAALMRRSSRDESAASGSEVSSPAGSSRPIAAMPKPTMGTGVKRGFAAFRAQRRRGAALRWGSFGVLVVALGIIAAIDASRGVPIVTYGWVMVGVSLCALVAGGLSRRLPLLNVAWLMIGVAIVVLFGASGAELRDGSGDLLIAPDAASALPPSVRHAAGRTTIDVSGVPTRQLEGRTIHISQGVGLVTVKVPRGEPVHLNASVRLGSVALDGNHLRSGFGETTTASYGTEALNVDVRLATGSVEINHVLRH